MDYLPLEDCLVTLIDYRGKTPKKTESGIRLITAKVIKKGTITDSSFEYIAENEYDSWMRRGLPVKGDVLLTTEAPLGEVAQIRSSEKIALAQRVILLRANPEILDQDYLLFAMQSHVVQGELNARATGTTVAGIKQSELRKVLIPIPPMEAQREIGLILHNYDNIIENNTRRIAILEDMAQSLYREWFVNFRYPNHEDNLDADGKPKLIDSPLGQIPEGWQVKEFSTSFDFWNGKKCVKSEAGEFDLYGANGIVGKAEGWKYENAIIIGRVGAYCGAVEYCFDKFWGSDNTIIAKCKSENNISYLFLLLKHFNLNKYAGGSAQPLLTQTTLKQLKYIAPPEDLVEQFELIARKLFENVVNLKKRNENLKQQRDMLLPKLISGQIEL